MGTGGGVPHGDRRGRLSIVGVPGRGDMGVGVPGRGNRSGCLWEGE